MKLLDIDNTVASGVENIAKMGMSMLTLHAYPKAMKAAVEAAAGSGLCLLGVTVLTSMDADDLAEAGYSQDPHSLVLRRAEQARAAGMGGIVCSAEEATAVREIVGPEMAIVTPGIRPDGSDKGDQKRVMTPFDALKAGATHLVVGLSLSSRRPIPEMPPAPSSARWCRRSGLSKPLIVSTTKGRRPWPKDIGSPASTFAMPSATRIMWRPPSKPSKSMARISWRAAAPSPNSRARRASATW